MPENTRKSGEELHEKIEAGCPALRNSLNDSIEGMRSEEQGGERREKVYGDDEDDPSNREIRETEQATEQTSERGERATCTGKRSGRGEEQSSKQQQ
ncbi:hypothetical protein GY45DRAFT_754669 [Cubamyces sp. BRFM 1775]|nr:hypothetical protein GY45DRAFT_754669 [Cubamyces sp. BRFM 1775]